MMFQVANHAEQIASSAAHAAWVGAAASTFASIVALGVAVWGARRDESRRRQLAKDQETAFAFGMVGALEMIKPIIVDAQSQPEGEITRRGYIGMVDQAIMIADGALTAQSWAVASSSILTIFVSVAGYLLSDFVSALS